MIYCVDTSSLIAAWQERYPIENFPKFWDRMDGLTREDRLISPVEVFHEIKKRSDELHAWLKDRKDAIFRDRSENVRHGRDLWWRISQQWKHPQPCLREKK